MGTFHSMFDTIEEYRFSFGQYRGKTLKEIIDKEDCIEYLKWCRKKLKREIKNVKAERFAPYNKRGLKEIEDYLISIGQPIERTFFEGEEIQENNIELPTNNFKKEKPISNNNSKSFKELLNILDEKLLSRFDEKFQSKKYIRNEYRDYLCLRYGNKTYIETLETQDIDVLNNILNNM